MTRSDDAPNFFCATECPNFKKALVKRSAIIKVFHFMLHELRDYSEQHFENLVQGYPKEEKDEVSITAKSLAPIGKNGGELNLGGNAQPENLNTRMPPTRLHVALH